MTTDAPAQATAVQPATPLSTLITVAPNGAYKQRADHPSLPLTAYALAQEAKRCLDAGAGMIHLHVRTARGEHLLDATAYAEATTAIRRAVGQALVVQVTTEAGKRYAPPAQMAVVRSLRPEAASFSIAELVPDAGMHWSVCAFGPSESACVLTAAALGGSKCLAFTAG